MVFRGSRNIGRTPGCLDWSRENPARKIFKRSNFIKHIELECHKIPENERYYNPKAACWLVWVLKVLGRPLQT